MDFLLGHFVLFTLVLSRTSGLVIAAPFYSAPEAPVQIRALLALALALVIAPSQLAAATPAPASLVAWLLLAGGELLVGLTLGFGVMLLFAGLQLAGQIIGQTSGMTLAEVFNPGFDADLPLFSQLLYLLGLAVFLAIGGHRLLISGLLDTFAAMPPGRAAVSQSVVDSLVVLLTQSFSLGIRAAAPATAALLSTTLAMALVSRTLPQLNSLALGMGINSLVTLGMLSLSLGGIAWAFEAELEPSLVRLVQAFY